ncbi:MAG: hypothetical protein EAZ08_03715 [Cytophagales bacterium]|nr:MAG: hypothetical protein EAZ08_03715 [Cytophagales bacterium]
MENIKLPTSMRLKIATYRFMFLIAASFLAFNTVYAQNKKISPDSLKKQLADSLNTIKKAKKPFKFTVDGVRAGFDLSYPITDNLFSPFQNSIPIPNATPVAPSYKYRYEGTVDVGFAQNRFFAVFDYGYSRVERSRTGLNYTGFSYDSQGSYFRLGADYNFMHRTFKDEVMFVGFRYAAASFKHNFTYYGASEAWGYRVPRLIESTATIVDDRFVGTITESGLSANWLEIVLGLKVNVWKQFFMGYTARFMLLSKVKGENQLIANDLPGFGSTNKQGRVVLNYYISYRIAFKTKAKIPLLKKSVEGKTDK